MFATCSTEVFVKDGIVPTTVSSVSLLMRTILEINESVIL
jgi:hypothetical protein